MTAPRARSILFVIDSLAPYGAERSIAGLVPDLVAGGWRVDVAVLRATGSVLEEAVRAAGATLHVAVGANRLARLRALRSIVRDVRPGIVQTTLYDADVLGRLAAWRSGAVVLSSIRNASYSAARRQDRAVDPRRLALARLVDAQTARHLTDHFHAVSASTAAAAVDALGIDRARVDVVPSGRDPAELGERTADRRARVRATLGFDEDVPVVLNVGRQEFQKAQVDVIDALAAVREHVPAVLLVAGRDGSQSAAIRARIDEHHLVGAARLLGERSDVPDLLCAADVLVSSSLYEGSPGVVLEAMALGVPVVATEVAGTSEVVVDGATGLLVPPGAPGAMADALVRVLRDGELAARLGACGRARFDEQYRTSATHRAMIDLYERLASERFG